MKVFRIIRLLLSIYVIAWLIVTPASKLGGPWWACFLMVCASIWLIEAIEALRRR
jgi:hypothetical protein